MATKKRKQSKAHEIVSYSITGFFWLCGLALCIMGVYAFNGPGRITDNPMYIAQKGFTSWLGWSSMVDFRVFGTLVCLVTMAIFLMFVYHYANKNRAVSDRRKRQLARLNELIEKDKEAEAKKAALKVDTTKVVDAEAKTPEVK